MTRTPDLLHLTCCTWPATPVKHAPVNEGSPGTNPDATHSAIDRLLFINRRVDPQAPEHGELATMGPSRSPDVSEDQRPTYTTPVDASPRRDTEHHLPPWRSPAHGDRMPTMPTMPAACGAARPTCPGQPGSHGGRRADSAHTAGRGDLTCGGSRPNLSLRPGSEPDAGKADGPQGKPLETNEPLGRAASACFSLSGFWARQDQRIIS